jgi:hypothetical protein
LWIFIHINIFSFNSLNFKRQHQFLKKNINKSLFNSIVCYKFAHSKLKNSIMKTFTKLPSLFVVLILFSIYFLSSCTSFQLQKKQYSYLNKVDAGTSAVQTNISHSPSTSLTTEQTPPIETQKKLTPIEIVCETSDKTPVNTISPPQFKPLIPIKKDIADNFFNQIQPGKLLFASSSGEKSAPLIDAWTVILWLIIILLIAAILSVLRIDILTILGIVLLVLLILLLIGYLSYY